MHCQEFIELMKAHIRPDIITYYNTITISEYY